MPWTPRTALQKSRSPAAASKPAAQNDAEIQLKEREIAGKERETDLKEREVVVKEQESRRSRWSTPLFVAIVAASLAALANAWLARDAAESNARLAAASAKAAQALERQKWSQARADEHSKSASLAISEFSRDTVRTLQAGSWLLFHAIHEPQIFGRKHVDAYDSVVREAVPGAFTSLNQLGSYSGSAHAHLAPMLTQLSSLDADLSVIARGHLRRTAKARFVFMELRQRVDAQLQALGPSTFAAAAAASREIERENAILSASSDGPPATTASKPSTGPSTAKPVRDQPAILRAR